MKHSAMEQIHRTRLVLSVILNAIAGGAFIFTLMALVVFLNELMEHSQ